jgi:hypothetical protein
MIQLLACERLPDQPCFAGQRHDRAELHQALGYGIRETRPRRPQQLDEPNSG